MNKNELVKYGRSVTQELKLVQKELEDLKAQVESSTQPKQEVGELPYKAFSMITTNKNKAEIVPITFDMEGNAVVHLDAVKSYNAPYKAAHQMNKLVTLEVETQKVKV